MSRKLFIYNSVRCILYNEDYVEPAEKRDRQIYILIDVLKRVICSEQRVCCSNYRSSCVESRNDSSLSNAYSLLLHNLMQNTSIVRPHLVKLVYARYSQVCKNYCTSFQHHKPTLLFHNCRSIMNQETVCNKCISFLHGQVVDQLFSFSLYLCHS